MKKMKAISHLLVAGIMVIGAACSSTNSGPNATSGSNTGASGGSTAGNGATGTRMGTDMNPTPLPDNNSGAPASTSQTATDTGSGTAASGATTAAAADVTAFMGTFATMQDPVFLMNAASSNLLEIQAGQLASQKATNADVKKFAQMMVSHHTKATQDLKAVATPLGITMPQTMMPVHQAMVDRLTNKTGKDFDETYMDVMETAHKMDIAMFEVKSKSAEKPAVQAFATKTLPMLRSHETMANNIEKKVD